MFPSWWVWSLEFCDCRASLSPASCHHHWDSGPLFDMPGAAAITLGPLGLSVWRFGSCLSQCWASGPLCDLPCENPASDKPLGPNSFLNFTVSYSRYYDCIYFCIQQEEKNSYFQKPDINYLFKYCYLEFSFVQLFTFGFPSFSSNVWLLVPNTNLKCEKLWLFCTIHHVTNI